MLRRGIGLTSAVRLSAGGVPGIVLPLLSIRWYSTHCSYAPASGPSRTPERLVGHVGRIIGPIERRRGIGCVRCVTVVGIHRLHSVGVGSMIVIAAASARGSHVVIAIACALAVSTVMQSVCTSSSSTETSGRGSICVRVVTSGEWRDMRRFNRRGVHSVTRVAEQVDRVGSPVSWIKLKRDIMRQFQVPLRNQRNSPSFRRGPWPLTSFSS